MLPVGQYDLCRQFLARAGPTLPILFVGVLRSEVQCNAGSVLAYASFCPPCFRFERGLHRSSGVSVPSTDAQDLTELQLM